MKTVITFKLAAQTRDELINTFAKEATAYRTVIETAHARGLLGDPALTELRWLIVGGKWDDSVRPYIPSNPLEGEETHESDSAPEPDPTGSINAG